MRQVGEAPTRTGARTAAAKIARNQSAELQEPASNRFVRNIDATLGQQILDITKRKCEPGVEPDRMLDDLGRKTMSFERYRGHTETVPVPPRADYRLNVSMPHELVFVYKAGTAPHINNVELGKHGRNRTNIWSYAGINSFGKDRDADLARHRFSPADPRHHETKV